MNKLKRIQYILIIMLLFILSIWPYKITYHLILCSILLFFNIVIYFKEKSKYKIDKLDIILILYPIINLLIVIFNLNVDTTKNNLISIYIEFSLITSALVYKRDQNNSLPLFIEIITTIYFILGISTIAFKNDLLLLGISSYFGDTYINSIDRFYGSLNYPNATSLLGLLGIISSIYMINSDKENKYLHITTLFISTLLYLYVFSKMISIDLIITLILYIVYLTIYDKKQISNIISLIVSLIIPCLISISLFRYYLINHNILLFIICLISLNTIVIILYKILLSLNKYVKSVIITSILIIVIVLTLKPINKPLKINHVKDNNSYYLIDFYLDKNSEYDIELNYQNNNNEEFYLVMYYLNGLTPTSKIVGKIDNKIHIKTGNDFEYYMIYIDNINKYTNITINNLIINNNKYYFDYKLIPFQLIHQLDLLKYDQESVSHRFWYYKDCLKYIKENKYLIGRGTNSFKYYSKNNNKYLEKTPHSYILNIWLESGIYGLILYIFIIIYSLSNIILYRKDKENIIYSLLFISLMMFSAFDATFDKAFFRLLMYLLLVKISNYKNKKNNNVMFISSSGGHFTELLKLKKIYNKYNYIIVTEKNDISLKYKTIYNIKYLAYGARYYPLKYPLVCIINIIKSIYYFFKYNPSVIFTTGAHTCVVISYLVFIFNKKIIYLEVFDRIDNPTLTGYLLYPISSIFYVQHKEMLKKFKKAKLLEGIY